MCVRMVMFLVLGLICPCTHDLSELRSEGNMIISHRLVFLKLHVTNSILFYYWSINSIMFYYLCFCFFIYFYDKVYGLGPCLLKLNFCSVQFNSVSKNSVLFCSVQFWNYFLLYYLSLPIYSVQFSSVLKNSVQFSFVQSK